MTIRPAKIGDQGTHVSLQNHSSIGALAVQITEDEQALLYGDWRMVADLVEAFGGERVEIVEGEGSAYGIHDIRQIG